MKILPFLALIASSLFCKAQDTQTSYPAPENNRFRIVGYAPGYRDLSRVPDRTLQRLNIACYAFATIDSTGIPRVRDEKQLRRFARRAQRLGLDVMISFNGKHADFARMAADAEKRRRFVAEIERLITEYRLAGVDNDWEFPRTTDGTAESNLALMKDLARMCRSGKTHYLLTMAITSGTYPGNRSQAIGEELAELVDWFNVMVYGDFSETQPGRHHSPYRMLEKSYGYWIVERGMDPKKFVVGLPVYGLASGLPKKTSATSYAGILRQNGPDAIVRDTAQVSNSVHTEPYTVYYNGLPTIHRKVNFAIDKHLGGIMFWEIAQDTADGTSVINAACQAVESRQSSNATNSHSL